MDFGIADHRQGACHEQTAQITIASFAHPSVLVAAPTVPALAARLQRQPSQ
jgi:hypothetical protein